MAVHITTTLEPETVSLIAEIQHKLKLNSKKLVYEYAINELAEKLGLIRRGTLAESQSKQ
jgi:hypothetical protein